MKPKKAKRPVETTLGTAPRVEDPVDESILQRPIATSVFGLRQVLTLLTTATDEVKEYVAMECDVLYECRVCRALFRSLANFVLHKRKYCTEKYFRPQRRDEPDDGEAEEETHAPCPNTPLDAIVRKLREKQDVDRLIDEVKEEDLSSGDRAEARAAAKPDAGLERIESNDHAVFQSGMKSEVMEICDMLDNNEAIIGPDGKWRSASARPMRCKECGQVFTTRKTLMYHVKYKHNGSRLVYACPDCGDTYANAWSVYRHLLKVHRKTMSQIRKLRAQVCNNAVRRDEEPLKRRDAEPEPSDNDKDDVENQWLADIETDSYFQMCGGCGKRFERKAALQSHTHTCLKRQQVCQTIQNNKRRAEENNNVNDKRESPKRATSKKKGSAKRKPEGTSRRKVATPSVDHNANCDGAPDALGKDEVFDIIGYGGGARPSPPSSPEPPSDRLLRRSFPYINMRALTCLGCGTAPPYATLADLLRHMSRHFLWYRFQCRLCPYVSYDRSDCEGHAATTHAHADDATAVLPLPQWKSEAMARKRCGRIVGAADSPAATGYCLTEGPCYDDEGVGREKEEEQEQAAREECGDDGDDEEEDEAGSYPEVIVIDDSASEEEPASTLFVDETDDDAGAPQVETVHFSPSLATEAGQGARPGTVEIDLDPGEDEPHTLELPAYYYVEPCRYDSPSPSDMKRDDFVEDCCLDESWEQGEPELVDELPGQDDEAKGKATAAADRPRRTVKRSSKVRLEDFEYDLAVLNKALRYPSVVRPKRVKKAKAPKKTD